MVPLLVPVVEEGDEEDDAIEGRRIKVEANSTPASGHGSVMNWWLKGTLELVVGSVFQTGELTDSMW